MYWSMKVCIFSRYTCCILFSGIYDILNRSKDGESTSKALLFSLTLMCQGAPQLTAQMVVPKVSCIYHCGQWGKGPWSVAHSQSACTFWQVVIQGSGEPQEIPTCLAFVTDAKVRCNDILFIIFKFTFKKKSFGCSYALPLWNNSYAFKQFPSAAMQYLWNYL